MLLNRTQMLSCVALGVPQWSQFMVRGMFRIVSIRVLDRCTLMSFFGCCGWANQSVAQSVAQFSATCVLGVIIETMLMLMKISMRMIIDDDDAC